VKKYWNAHLYVIKNAYTIVKESVFRLDISVKLIDLSHKFIPRIPVYPGDEPVKLSQIASIDKHGFTNYQVTSGMHVGTHIDAPFHFISGGKCISDISLDRFYGPGVLVDVRNEKIIDREVLEGISINKDNVVLFLTGQDRFYGKPEYFQDYPVLTDLLAQKLVDLGIKMIGVDTASPDRYPFSLHKLFLKDDILILENLTHLEQLVGEKFELFAFPIKFETDAAFVRAVAKME